MKCKYAGGCNLTLDPKRNRTGYCAMHWEMLKAQAEKEARVPCREPLCTEMVSPKTKSHLCRVHAHLPQRGSPLK